MVGFSDTAHNNYYIILLLVCPCKKKKKKQKGHAKRRQLSCRDREDACKLLSQGATANALAKKYVLELRRRCSSHSDACNRQVTDPVSPTASVEPRNSPLPSAHRRVLIRSCFSICLCQTWSCCLAGRRGSYGNRPSNSVRVKSSSMASVSGSSLCADKQREV